VGFCDLLIGGTKKISKSLQPAISHQKIADFVRAGFCDLLTKKSQNHSIQKSAIYCLFPLFKPTPGPSHFHIFLFTHWFSYFRGHDSVR